MSGDVVLPAAGGVDLVLYVNAASPASQRARETAGRVLSRFASGSVRLAVRDVSEHPLDAEGDGVLFAPTLVKRHPAPRAWVVGDMGDGAALATLLRGAGLEDRDE